MTPVQDDALAYFYRDDIEFYLDTKRVKDESKITTESSFLEKWIRLIILMERWTLPTKSTAR